MINPPRIDYEGDKVAAQRLKGNALNFYALVCNSMGYTLCTQRDKHVGNAIIRVIVITAANGDKNGVVMIYVPTEDSVDLDISGFIARHNPVNDEKDPVFFSTNNGGFGGLSEKTKYLSAVAKPKQWIGKAGLITWDMWNQIFYLGKQVDTGSVIVGAVLACALMTTKIIVVFDAEGLVYFLSVNGEKSSLLSAVRIISDSFDTPDDIVRFNHDATKLVFIASTVETKSIDLPFDSNIEYQAGSGDANSITSSMLPIFQDEKFPFMPSVGDTSHGLSLDETYITQHKKNWQCIYRFDLNESTKTITLLSKTMQYAEHVYRFTSSEANTYSHSTEYVDSLPAAESFAVTGSASVETLYNESYVSNIWFGIDGTEYSEIVTSAIKFDVTSSMTQEVTREFVDGSPVTTIIVNGNQQADYGLSHKAVSAYNEQKNTLFLTETVITSYESIEHPLYAPEITHTIEESGKAGGHHTQEIIGFNGYIPNSYTVAYLVGNTGDTIANYQDQVAGEQFIPLPSPITAYDESLLDVRGVVLEQDDNPLHRYHITYDLKIGAPITQPHWDSTGELPLSVGGAWSQDCWVSRLATITPVDISVLDYSYPESIPYVYPPYDPSKPPINATKLCQCLMFLASESVSSAKADNNIVLPLIDKYGNILIATDDAYAETPQKRVKIFKKNFGHETIEKQNEVSAVASEPYDILGVV